MSSARSIPMQPGFQDSTKTKRDPYDCAPRPSEYGGKVKNARGSAPLGSGRGRQDDNERQRGGERWGAIRFLVVAVRARGGRRSTARIGCATETKPRPT